MITRVMYKEYNGVFYKIIEEEYKGYAGTRKITNRMIRVDAVPDQTDEESNKIYSEKDVEEGRCSKSCDDNFRKH